MREVDARDLEMFAINTGELYQRHLRLAEVPQNGWAWVRHVRDHVLPLYCKQVEPVFAPASIVEAVAVALHEYYARHVAETKALEDRYHVQVNVREGGNTYAWRRVHPTGGDPYVFTKQEAEQYCKVHGLQSGDPQAYRIEKIEG